MAPQKRYILRYGSTTVSTKITEIKSQLDFETLSFESTPKKVNVNSISEVQLKTASAVYLDDYKENPKNGYFILVDEVSNSTVAVGFKES